MRWRKGSKHPRRTASGTNVDIWLPTDDGQAIPIGIYSRNRFYAVHADHLGTPRLITDDVNKPVWQWPYSAFGSNKPTGVLKATPNPKATGSKQDVALNATDTALEVNLRFPGQYFDEESNLSYNYFRSYNAAQGRYSQPDPVGMAAGPNRFSYVNNAALSFVDPIGLMGQGSGGGRGSPVPARGRPAKQSCTCTAAQYASGPNLGLTVARAMGLGAGAGAVAGGVWGTATSLGEIAISDATATAAMAGSTLGAATLGVGAVVVVGGIYLYNAMQSSPPMDPSQCQ
ncbi:RHS repeat-associated core domain-containing protein [Caenimonas terrae]|uniref:RHS repeat-associated core domain-containing protein n=1 Tax=Caenimonas terrae TaxID=696074 RepID=A0ABW0N9Z8_9BURK